MHRWLWLWVSLLLPLLDARTAEAAACIPGSLQNYIDLGVSGCSAGDVLLSSFFLESGQSFATPIAPALIQVTPTGASGLLLTFASSASAGELREAFFHFTAEAPALFAAGVELAGASATGDGVVTATQDVCPDGSFFAGGPIGCPGVAATLITFVSASDSLLTDHADFAGSAFLDVLTDIAIDGGLAGSAGLGSVTLSFSTIPEPSTAALLATGLALLARSRTRRGD